MLELGELTPEALTRTLRKAGLLGDGARVADLDLAPLGTGQTADSFRATLRHHPDLAGPATLVVKTAAADEATRVMARRVGWYEREARFYRELAPGLDVSLPAVHHIGLSGDGERYLLVMEDLAPARTGDQLAGVTPDEAALVLEQAAALHAPRWGDPTLHDLPWLDVGERERAAFARRMPRFHETFRQLFGERAGEVRLAHRLVETAPAWFARQPRPWTLQHGDLRPDNVLFGAGGGSRPVVVVDWQTVVVGPALVDVAYFLGGGLRVEDRRAHEEDLLRHYHDALKARGVRGYALHDCRRDYRWAAAFGWYMAVGSAVTVERTPRGDEMFMTMAARHAAHAADVERLTA